MKKLRNWLNLVKGKPVKGDKIDLSLKGGLKLKHSIVPKDFTENFPYWDSYNYDSIIHID